MLYLNGATIMTTPTVRHIEISRLAGFDGVEVRAERLLEAPDELAEAAAIVRPGEVWSLNGIQLQLAANGTLDRERLDSELPPRLDICRVLGAAYLLVVPPRSAGADRDRSIAAMRDGLAVTRDRAAAIDVGTAFEFLGFGDCPIDTPSLAGEVVAEVPGVEVVLDSCHWHASGSGSIDDFPVDRLAMTHLNDAPPKPPREIEDADRLLPGDGVIRLAELVDALRARGYGGPWSLETFNPTYWSEDPLQVARRGRQLVGDVLASEHSREDVPERSLT
ncbi:MAG TPA: sugar phosphate isomerase/epimerase [Candidatus Limnocylindrales bacterium]|nr:sugar phosphate isomerase/epimerase [Candidatus Limnocylindrales bacterium]